jgi:hypothetical protein
MKKVLFSFAVLSVSLCLQAQTKMPSFAKLGYNKQVLYTSSKGEFEEFHDQTDVVEIGNVFFNTVTKKIVGFVSKDAGISSATTAMTIDPHCERYYWISPYAFCLNNPVRYIDPTGMDVYITGDLSDEALRQLQDRAGKSITLSRDDQGKVTYTSNTDKKLKGAAKQMVGMIDDSSITVNVATTAETVNSNGDLMIGGSFMGTTITKKDADGNAINVSVNQEVNPNVLGSVDEFTKTPGKMMMHEITEAYGAGKISQTTGVDGGYSQITPSVSIISSIYQQAHDGASPQTPITRFYYDKNGKQTNDASKAVRVEWKVFSGWKSKIIQTYP